MIPINIDIEQNVFMSKEIGPDGNWLSNDIWHVIDNIKRLIAEFDQMEAAVLSMQLIKSICRHFISDRHWECFDDKYYPDFDIKYILRLFTDLQEKGELRSDVSEYLSNAWKEIAVMESKVQYGIPSAKLHLVNNGYVCID